MSLDEISDIDIGGLKESRLDYDFINRHVITDTVCPAEEEKEKGVASSRGSEEDQKVDSKRVIKARNGSFLNQKTTTDFAVKRSDRQTAEIGIFEKSKPNDSFSDRIGINKLPGGSISDKASDDDRDRLSQTGSRVKTTRVSFISPAGKSIVPFAGDDNEEQRKIEGERNVEVAVIQGKGEGESTEEVLFIDKELFQSKSSLKAAPTWSKRRRSSAVAACDSETDKNLQQLEEEGAGIGATNNLKKHKETGMQRNGKSKNEFTSFFSYFQTAEKDKGKGEGGEETKVLLNHRSSSSHNKYRQQGLGAEDYSSDSDSSSDGEVCLFDNLTVCLPVCFSVLVCMFSVIIITTNFFILMSFSHYGLLFLSFLSSLSITDL